MQHDNPKMTLTTTTFSQTNDSTAIRKNKKKKMMGNQRWKALTCALTSGFSSHGGSKSMMYAATSSEHNHLEVMVLCNSW